MEVCKYGNIVATRHCAVNRAGHMDEHWIGHGDAYGAGRGAEKKAGYGAERGVGMKLLVRLGMG